MCRLPERLSSQHAPSLRRSQQACFDVAIVGAGPAGAATALGLARKGFSVALISRRRSGWRVGETVPPTIVKPLSALGLWETFIAARHLEAPGTVVAWGNSRPFENDFILNAYGPGWHLDRAGFDAMIVNSARDAGARVQDGLVQHCFHCERDVWRLHVQSPDGPSIIEARWVVDASGRCSWLARRLGAARVATDRLLSLVKWLPSEASTEKRTLIEACETGWWYSANVPGCRTVIAYFSDIDLLPKDRSERTVEWNARFSLTSLTSGVHGNAANERAHCFAAASEHVVQSAGRRWIAVGDAEASFDPLSGQGIINALTSALDGTAFIAGRFEKEATCESFLRSSQTRYAQYLQLRGAYYGRETRWPDALFWRRRRPGASGTDGIRAPTAVAGVVDVQTL
jgi:flavin-dependent dehydrogenase